MGKGKGEWAKISPPNTVLSVMKYVEMGSVTMANVNARSLYITALCALQEVERVLDRCQDSNDQVKAVQESSRDSNKISAVRRLTSIRLAK